MGFYKTSIARTSPQMVHPDELELTSSKRRARPTADTECCDDCTGECEGFCTQECCGKTGRS